MPETQAKDATSGGKTARRRVRKRASNDIHLLLPQALAEDLSIAARAAGTARSEWLVAAVRSALQAQAERREIGKLAQIQDRIDSLGEGLRTVKDRVEALHSRVPALRNEHMEEEQKAFSGIAEALEKTNQTLDMVAKLAISQRIMIAAILLGSSESTRKALNSVVENKDRINELIEGWRK